MNPRLLVSMLLFAAACPHPSEPASDGGAGGTGGGGGSAGSGGGAAGGGAQACAELAAARCDRLGACSATALASRYASMAACIAQVDDECRARKAAAGALETDADVLACAQRYPDAGCTEVVDPGLSPCTAVKGQRAAGADCFFDQQCASGQCGNHRQSRELCGTCLASVDAGAECNPDPDHGAICGDGLSCIDGTCQAGGGVARLGESCASSSFARCALDTWCDGAVCRPPKHLGDACSELVEECSIVDGLFCDPDVHRCVAIPVSGAGERCLPIGSPGGALCGGGLVCKAGFVCAPAGSPGAPCGPGPDAGTCNANGFCRDGICLSVARLSCAGGDVDAGSPAPPTTFIFDIPSAGVSLDCAAGQLSVDAHARYGNQLTVAITATVDSVEVRFDGGVTLPVSVLPTVTPQVPPMTGIAVEHTGAISFAPAPCGQCGQPVSLTMSVTSSEHEQRAFTAQTSLRCDGGQ
ncbi:MAG: hypothetical protein IPJ65_04985 [Archangiaceae bacterium]|nr:hypothetical protein [Archangiaceae bacterium]